MSIEANGTDQTDISRYGPRERILQLGEMRLSDAECVALLLRTGQRGESAEQMAQRLLRRFGRLSSLADAPVREIAGERGVGAARASALSRHPPPSRLAVGPPPPGGGTPYL